MNKHFTKNHDIIVDTTSTTPSNAEGCWMGIIPHSGMVVEEITIKGVNGSVKLDGTTTPLVEDYMKDLPVGVPFLCEITQIKLSTPGCKMINPS